jgi:hypothetical protein
VGGDVLLHPRWLPEEWRQSGTRRSAVEFTRERGARGVEGFPITTKNVIMEELHLGTEGVVATPALLRSATRPCDVS